MDKPKLNMKFSVEHFRVVFDLVLIVIAIFSLFAAFGANKTAHEANQLTAQSLRNAYIPWLKIVRIDVTLTEDGKIKIVYALKNYAEAPAINLKISTKTMTTQNIGRTYLYNAIMPNDENEMDATYSGPQPEKLINEINNGNEAIQFTINFSDIFGNNYSTEQEIKKIGNDFKDINYRVNGIEISTNKSGQ